jgi:hypothetical protein
MMKSLFFLTFASIVFVVDAATKVAVIELGKGGTVRRTTAKSIESSVDGVASFWNALHGSGRRRLQHPGMTVVPDLFRKADSSVVIGVSGSGIDLSTMPLVAGLVSEESKNGVVGHMEISGHHCHALLSHLDQLEEAESLSIDLLEKHAKIPGISGMKIVVDTPRASALDQQISVALLEMDEQAKASGQTIVVNLVVEESEDTGASSHRRLEGGGEEEGQEGGEQGGGEGGADNANGDGSSGQFAGYYGYGYYNAYGEWVTPYKTMFQIQYFNVVLWTSVGLTLILFSSIFMMIYMPLEPDTLLFGESAKLMED